ncbi:uroporphyrinogen-III C-methyltransferase [Methylocaldum sp.]|uniref:uroporphyrinogen-III C-methyltransferase n=1 Tax=Methylocaldum sp. TaxID=1969727 RepID=UPI002D75C547|nr:uroporphyrinogen-III C-methyltransferase [Methylocaldum sp.]HYE35273.1 uroporphyrinogen-III C-methyltransferase [Methylocaldum sp.]
MSATGQSANGAETEAEKTSAVRPKKSRNMAWVGYTILLSVLILTAGGWFILQELRSKQEGLGGQLNSKDQQILEVTRQLNALQSEMATLHSQFATLQSQVTTEDSKFERQIGEQSAQINERLNLTRTELGESVQQIQRQLNKTHGDLLVADAEYLLSIANQKLHLIGDVKAVLAAMEAADQRLHDSGDPAVFKVREALAEEIDTLRRLNAPDVVGLSSKLLILEGKVKDIPLFLPHAGKSTGQPAKPEAAAPTSEGEGEGPLDSALDNFKDLVTIRRTDRPVDAILHPEQAEALRQVLLLKLETARAALLRGDEGMYKANLASAQEWLTEHFDPGSDKTQEVATEISALAEQPIRIPFPDISKSLTLLRNIEKLRLEADEAGIKPNREESAKTQSGEPSGEAQPAGAQP